MFEPLCIQVLAEGQQEHPAVKAWRRLQPDGCEPHSIQILRCKQKSAVYRLNGVRSDGAAVIAKRCRQAAAVVERMIYEELLPRVSAPGLRCYGFLEEPEGEFCWLFLEDAAGDFYSPQLAHHRAVAGRWLAEIQLATPPADLKARLPARDLGHYLRLLRGCRVTLLDHLAGNTALSSEDAVVFRRFVAHCDAIESHWSQMERICDVIPRTLVHDDFVIKNVRIRDGAAGPALLVFDWELAGWGVPGPDLAQFVDGVASPDLAVYCSLLKREHPHLDLRDVQRVAACGNLLRLVDQIYWATSRLEFGANGYLLKVVLTLGVYEASLVEALSAFRGC